MALFDKSSLDSKKVIIFDGECVFCNRSILFIRKHNRKDNLLYCPSQSQAAQELIQMYRVSFSPDESLIYIKEGKVHFLSGAPLEIAKELDHFWAMLSLFLIIPKRLRDLVYIFIAKNRKSILGNTETCAFENSKLFKGKVLE